MKGRRSHLPIHHVLSQTETGLDLRLFLLVGKLLSKFNTKITPSFSAC